ncbi:AIR synthase-related protein, partial [Escherichia coli]|nr:AIR synthase-related protein [Escherichia coli]
SMKTKWEENGESKEVTSPLSLVITAFGRVEDVRKTVTPQLRTPDTLEGLGDTSLVLVDLGNGKNRLGATALAQVYKQLGDKPADVDNAEQLKGFFDAMQNLVRNDKLLAYHDKGDGGLFVTLAEMAFAGHCGVNADIAELGEDALAVLFNEELGAVVQVKNDDLDSVLSTLAANGL